MKDLQKELIKVLAATVDMEFACENREGCRGCICSENQELCDIFPLLIDTIQDVLYHEG